MTPPVRVSVPVRIWGLPIARISNASPIGLFSTEIPPGAPATTVPITTRTPSTAIASAPAFQSSLRTSSIPSPPIGPWTVIAIPCPLTAVSPAHARIFARSSFSSSTVVSPRSLAASRLVVWRARSALSSRSWSLPVVRFAISWVSSVDDRFERPGTPAWPRSWPMTRTPRIPATTATLMRLLARLAVTGPSARSWVRPRRGHRLGVAQRDGAGEGRQVDRVELRDRPMDAVALDPATDELDERGGRSHPVVEVRRADGGDRVRRGEVGRVHEDRAADVDDRGRHDDPLAVDRDSLRAGEPQLLDDRPDVAGGHERIHAGATLRAVLQPERDAWPLDRDEPGGEAGLLEGGVELAQRGGGAGPLGLELADPRAKPEDLRLECLLLRLQPQRSLDERRALLGRVADARPLGRDLGGDEESQDHERDRERHLDAREAAQARDERAHAGSRGGAGSGGGARSAGVVGDSGPGGSPDVAAGTCPSGASGASGSGGSADMGASVASGSPRLRPRAVTMIPAATTRPKAMSSPSTTGVTMSTDDPGVFPGTGRSVAPGPGVGTTGAAQPGGSGPGGAGCGPNGCGSSVPRSASHAASKPATSTPRAALKAASSLTPSA